MHTQQYRLGYLLMIASYTAPSALVQTVRPCKATWILWSDGVVHGAWSSIQKKCQIMSIVSGKLHPTYVYNLCGHVLSSVQIAKYLGITLTDELSWSSHVHSIHSRANSTLGFLRRNLWRCPAKLRDCVYYVSSLYTGVCSVHLESSFGQGLWLVGEVRAAFCEVC